MQPAIPHTTWLFESTADPALAVDVALGRILAANEQARRLLGLPERDLIENSVLSLFPGQAAALTAFTQAVLHKGSDWTRALTPARVDGTQTPVECVGTRLVGEPDPSILLTFYDLEARRRRDRDAQTEDDRRGGIGEWSRVERLFQEIEPGSRNILRAALAEVDRLRERLQREIQRLCHHDWAGNVRELQNVIERAAILARDSRLAIDLPDPTGAATTRPQPTVHPILTETERRDRDRASILAALETAGGKVSGPGGAAEILGVRPTTLASRIKTLGIGRWERRPGP
jgi:PAS domain S-box-containing protein